MISKVELRKVGDSLDNFLLFLPSGLWVLCEAESKTSWMTLDFFLGNWGDNGTIMGIEIVI